MKVRVYSERSVSKTVGDCPKEKIFEPKTIVKGVVKIS